MLEDEEIICPCSGTRVGRLKIRFQDGLRTLEALADATGVCTGCAGCEADVVELIAHLEANDPMESPVEQIDSAGHPGKEVSDDHV